VTQAVGEVPTPLSSGGSAPAAGRGDVGVGRTIARLRRFGPAATLAVDMNGQRVPTSEGERAFEDMFAAIAVARSSILLETYILDADGPGARLADLLDAKRRDGVSVYLIIDAIGSIGLPESYLARLRSAGVQLSVFNPIWPWQRGFRRGTWNHRTHRKLLIVDDRVAFVGGMNISSVYGSVSTGGERDAERPWRDTHARIEGPVVRDLRTAFADHWRRQTGRPLAAPTSPAPIESSNPGEVRLAVAASPAGSRRNPLYRVLLNEVTVCRRELLMTTPYFVPTRRLLRQLTRAARRGVRVAIALPAAPDSTVVRWMARSRYGALLRAGVEVYEYSASMLHAKSVVIDSRWFCIGSSNMDWRSLLHNAELNVIGLDPATSAGLGKIFARDLECCNRVRLEDWERRSWWERAAQRLLRPLEYLL
jgi:cardiolipin synthase A/B